MKLNLIKLVMTNLSLLSLSLTAFTAEAQTKKRREDHKVETRSGTESSANAPELKKPQPVFGHFRLTCSLKVGQHVGLMGENDAGKVGSSSLYFSPFETALDFEKKDGDIAFKCVRGCNPLRWQHREPTTGQLILPELETTKYGYPRLPNIWLEWQGELPFLHIHMEAAHISLGGTLITNQTHTMLRLKTGGGEMIAGAKTVELSVKSEEELIQEAKEKKTFVTESQTASEEMRCQILRDGDMSKAEIQEILMRPPGADRISFAQYEKLMVRDNNYMSTVLDLARTVDPDHRRAHIASRKLLFGSVAFLFAQVDYFKQLINANPKLTTNEAWSALSVRLDKPEESPSGIISFGLMPLIIAESEAQKKP